MFRAWVERRAFSRPPSRTGLRGKEGERRKRGPLTLIPRRSPRLVIFVMVGLLRCPGPRERKEKRKGKRKRKKKEDTHRTNAVICGQIALSAGTPRQLGEGEEGEETKLGIRDAATC